jgi:hypothetical protein
MSDPDLSLTSRSTAQARFWSGTRSRCAYCVSFPFPGQAGRVEAGDLGFGMLWPAPGRSGAGQSTWVLRRGVGEPPGEGGHLACSCRQDERGHPSDDAEESEDCGQGQCADIGAKREHYAEGDGDEAA